MPYVKQPTWLQMAPKRGLGDAFVPQGPLSPDQQAAYQAGVINAAGGDIPANVDLTSQMNQALFNAGFNAGSSGGPATATLGVLQTLGFPSSSPAIGGAGAPSITSWLQQNQTAVLWAGGILFGFALLKGLSK